MELETNATNATNATQPGLSLVQVAEAHRVTRQRVWRWIREGLIVMGVRVRLESVRVGGRIYVTPEALERWHAYTAVLEDRSAMAAAMRQHARECGGVA